MIHEAAPDDVSVGASRTPGEGGGPLLLWTCHLVLSSTLTVERAGQRTTFALPRESDKGANDRFVVWRPLEDGEHPVGSVVLRRFDGPEFERVLFGPGPWSAVEDILMSRDWLVMKGHHDLRPWLRVLDLRNPEDDLCEVPIPREATSVWAIWHAADPDSESGRDMRLNLLAEGQLLPSTLYRIDLDTMSDAPQLELVARAKPSFNASGMQMQLLEATSDDGTLVPYRLALPREAANEAVPVVVTAYGGYGFSVPANYLKLEGSVLLEKGIGFAVAHIRGGGEFGPQWHRAAMGASRPRAFKDCVAVARDLVARGVAPPKGIGFVGGSNGGLLATVMATRYPGD